jgi:hypothetical protein
MGLSRPEAPPFPWGSSGSRLVPQHIFASVARPGRFHCVLAIGKLAAIQSAFSGD